MAVEEPPVNPLSKKIFSPVDAASLGMFRILFGALMIWQAFYYLAKDRYIKYYLEPAFHFTFELFPFVSPLPEKWFLALVILMMVAAGGIMLGLFYRLSTLLFLLSFSYIFLLDKAYYNNHYYAILLLAFLLLIVDGHRWASLDQKLKPRPEPIPYWNLLALRLQLFVIYFFGGIAKLNADWFQGEPMRGWLQKLAESHPSIGYLLISEVTVYFFSWGGLFFDLSIGFFLWWRKTRSLAFLAVLFFNLSNYLLFQIGVFPFLMIAAATLFDDPDWPRKFFKVKGFPPPVESPQGESRRRWVWSFLGVYFLIQVLVPLRHWLYPGEVSWTEEGHYFSWHMKLRDKRGRLKVWATDSETHTTVQVDPREELNRLQYGKMIQRPQFIYQYVQHLKQKLRRQIGFDPVIQVDSWISLNGRPYQQAIDPEADLAKADLSLFSASEWILPLDTRLKPGTLREAEEVDPDL